MKVALGHPTMPPYANGPSHLRGKEKFQKAAHHELNNVTKRRNYQYATTTIRVKRQNVVDELDDWQQLREAAGTVAAEVTACAVICSKRTPKRREAASTSTFT